MKKNYHRGKLFSLSIFHFDFNLQDRPDKQDILGAGFDTNLCGSNASVVKFVLYFSWC